jgi:hypothetical protein
MAITLDFVFALLQIDEKLQHELNFLNQNKLKIFLVDAQPDSDVTSRSNSNYYLTFVCVVMNMNSTGRALAINSNTGFTGNFINIDSTPMALNGQYITSTNGQCWLNVPPNVEFYVSTAVFLKPDMMSCGGQYVGVTSIEAWLPLANCALWANQLSGTPVNQRRSPMCSVTSPLIPACQLSSSFRFMVGVT